MRLFGNTIPVSRMTNYLSLLPFLLQLHPQSEGMEKYGNFRVGNRVYFIASIEEYSSEKHSGILRRSFKVYRDSRVDKDSSRSSSASVL